MQQDTFQVNQISYLCQHSGHENEFISGYCLYEMCKINFPFCIQCMIDRKNFHKRHHDYLKSFNQIIQFFNKEIELLNSSDEQFQDLRFLFIKINGLIEKAFTYKSKGLQEKLSKIIINFI